MQRALETLPGHGSLYYGACLACVMVELDIDAAAQGLHAGCADSGRASTSCIHMAPGEPPLKGCSGYSPSPQLVLTSMCCDT